MKNKITAIFMSLCLAICVSLNHTLSPPLSASAYPYTENWFVNWLLNTARTEATSYVLKNYTSLDPTVIKLIQIEIGFADAAVSAYAVNSEVMQDSRSELTGVMTGFFYYSPDDISTPELHTVTLFLGKFYTGDNPVYTYGISSLGDFTMFLNYTSPDTYIQFTDYKSVYIYPGNASLFAPFTNSAYEFNGLNNCYTVKTTIPIISSDTSFNRYWTSTPTSNYYFIGTQNTSAISFEGMNWDSLEDCITNANILKNNLIEEFGYDLVNQYWFLEPDELPETTEDSTAELAPVVKYPSPLPYQQMPDNDFDLTLPEKFINGAKVWFTIFSDTMETMGLTGIVVTCLAISLVFWLVF